MLFRTRATQPEHFDDATRRAEEFRAAYGELARVNRVFRLDDPYTRVLSQWLGPDHCKDLSILDLGAGDGWLGRQMEAWAAKRGWRWHVTDLDLNPVPLSLSTGAHRIVASALELPFANNAFDLVIASQMTHHFNTEEDVVAHFQEAWRVGRHGLFITDMRRGAFLYILLCLALPALGLSREMRSDGLLSVRKSWTPREWRDLAARAGLREPTISGYFGTRLILGARKSATDAASGTSEQYPAMDEFYSAPSGK